MITTYSLVCHDCGQIHWVGQGNHFYEPDKVFELMKEHAGHSLEFVCDLTMDEREDLANYEDV